MRELPRLSENPRSEASPLAAAPMIPARPFRPQDAVWLIAGYLLLDWVSYIRPLHGLNITPWNPAPALALFFLMRFDRAALAPVMLALGLADLLIRGIDHLTIGLVLSLGLGLGYYLLAAALRQRLPVGEPFQTPRQMAEWAGLIILGTLLTSSAFVGLLALAGMVPEAETWVALQRHWVGDAVGILVALPVLWHLGDPLGRRQLLEFARDRDGLATLLLTLAALWIAFALGARGEFKYLYALFVPIAYAAARQRLTGAVAAATLLQVGVIGAAQMLRLSAATLVEIQWLVSALALFGMFIGVVVAERERVSNELRQTLRLAAAGEMAAALAHELNQPLTALAAYGAASEKLLDRGAPPEQVAGTIRQMVAEAHRAGAIVRRLRDFFRFGSSTLETLRCTDWFGAVTPAFVDRAQREGVEFSLPEGADCELVGDRLQLEVVLRNLLANAFDAVRLAPAGARRVTVELELRREAGLLLVVRDSGPGLSDERAQRIFDLFQTTKASGMGIGLAVSRSIVEAHGGQLWCEPGAAGCFKLLLPAPRQEPKPL